LVTVATASSNMFQSTDSSDSASIYSARKGGVAFQISADFHRVQVLAEVPPELIQAGGESKGTLWWSGNIFNSVVP
jgi:sugar (pentulose or hexulose) kinase